MYGLRFHTRLSVVEFPGRGNKFPA